MTASLLRPYQEKIITDTRALMCQGIKAVLIQSPTGSGKTLLTAHMLRTAASRGMVSWFIVHRRELVKQSIRAFDGVGIRYGVLAASFVPSHRQTVQIASIQTLAKRFEHMTPPRLIVWDECHHVAAGSWGKIFAAFPDAFHIGLSATPQRLDGTGLGKWFARMVEGPTVSWLIENKFLAPYKLFAPPVASLSGVHTRMGDFVTSELTAAIDKPTITGDAIKHYQQHAPGRRAVVFCASVEHSRHVVQQFLQAGIPAAHVDGETDVGERDRILRRFECGEIKVLSNIELFGEGFDLPALEVAILLRPTQSLGLYLQQVGRALRPHADKSNAIILDHAGNCARHGLPDEERQWNLGGRDKKAAGYVGNFGSVRICPKCFAAQRPDSLACHFCGKVFDVQARVVEEVEGTLEEVDVEMIRRQKKAEQIGAQSFDALVALGQKRGYKKPQAWARHIIEARKNRRVPA